MCGSRKLIRPFACLALALGIDVLDTAERFLEYFAPQLAAPGTVVPGQVTQPVMPPAAALGGGHAGGPLDALFSIQEFDVALGTLRQKSAPGPDGITNQALKNLPDVVRTRLLGWFNDIWVTCNVPLSWKMAWIISILKGGKLLSALGFYRPVFLLSCVGTLFERLLLYRRRWFLEGNGLLSPEQIGFRSHLGAEDSILDFESAVEHHRAIGEYTLAVFLDVEKAYDRVGADIAVASLCTMGISGLLLRLSGGYLQCSSIRVKLGSTVSSSRLLHVGLPQGSVLSPLLFNVVMARVAPCILRDHLLSTTIYADDVCLW